MVEYNPFWDQVIDDPWPTYKQMRDERPACYVEELDCWALSRFADITKVSMDRQHYTVSRGNTLTALSTPHRTSEPLVQDSTMFMMKDPPAHTAFRALLSPHFTPRKLAGVEPMVRKIVAEEFGPLREAGRFDAAEDLARVVASKVTCALLGLPEADAPFLRDLVQRHQPFIHGRPPQTPEEVAGAVSASAEFNAYLEEKVRERRTSNQKGEDILQTFIDARIEGEGMPGDEIAIHLSGLVIGGFETLPKHFGSVIYLLHRFADERAKIVSNPELLPRAIEEVFRYDAPTHVLGRRIVKDVEWHGEKMKAGQGLLLLYASANRDDREFERPDVFDIERKPTRTLTFGAGIHLCMGLHVARLESRVMLETILGSGPNYDVVDSGVERCRLGGIHGYDRVPIIL